MSSCAPRLLRPFVRRRPRAPWICTACLLRPALVPAARFSISTRHLSDSAPNHYEALQLSPTASAADIKRQFYTLSKQHHPDRNPNDPSASSRFVAISEAYHVLSVPEKRAQYDAQISQSQASRWGRDTSQHPQGSYSSASFAGSRPASGLSKRRGTFRGPPPSFYKSGGYGKHGAKRAEYAHHEHAGAKDAEDTAHESYGGFAGFGPGQTRHGTHVPHFDDRRHKQTHDNVNEHIHARRKTRRAAEIPELDRRGMLVNFVLVAGAVGIIGYTAKVLSDYDANSKKRKEGG